MASVTPIIRLPHPYLTSYNLDAAAAAHSYRISLALPQPADATLPPLELHNDALSFTIPTATPGAPDALRDNTPYARARRSLHSTVSWTGAATPTVGQLWLMAYVLFETYHAQETIRITLAGAGAATLAGALLTEQLVIAHPALTTPAQPFADKTFRTDELLLSRAAFWQGAASPFGQRAAWVADPSVNVPANRGVVEYTFSTAFPETRIYKRHPVRAAKPAPNSIMYSRWIRALNQHLTMVALDWRNPAHLHAFHTWQNDPRVAKGWMQTGPVEEHRQYLEDCEKDPHTVTVMGAFDGELFGYFEIYWASEDHFGAHFETQDFDRGRHVLSGNPNMRGPHRTRPWFSGLVHYSFLDDVRTQRVVGEPKDGGNPAIIQMDKDLGFWYAGTADFAHKRSVIALVSRENYFKVAALHWGEEMGFEGERVKKTEAKL